MTTVVRALGLFSGGSHWFVNGCLPATITEAEAASIDDFEAEAVRRVTPLVWLAMPVHDRRWSA